MPNCCTQYFHWRLLTSFKNGWEGKYLGIFLLTSFNAFRWFSLFVSGMNYSCFAADYRNEQKGGNLWQICRKRWVFQKLLKYFPHAKESIFSELFKPISSRLSTEAKLARNHSLLTVDNVWMKGNNCVSGNSFFSVSSFSKAFQMAKLFCSRL